jgi:hypothetical protein
VRLTPGISASALSVLFADYILGLDGFLQDIKGDKFLTHIDDHDFIFIEVQNPGQRLRDQSQVDLLDMDRTDPYLRLFKKFEFQPSLLFLP